MRKIDPLAPATIKSLLIHGLNNTGKTNVLGSMLNYERQYGKCVMVVMRGEPFETVFRHDLEGVELREVEKVEELPELARELQGVHAIALDSVQRLGEMAGIKITGGKYIIGAKEDHGRDWSKLKGETFNAMMYLQQVCDLFVAVCPSNIHENQITHEIRVIPDVAGVGEKLVGRFNFCGYLEMKVIDPTHINRTLDFKPRLDAVTRWNAKGGIPKKVDVVDELDCWVDIKTALERGLRGE